MNDRPKRRLVLIAKIFFVSASLTLLLAFLLPAMLSHAYSSKKTVDDAEADFKQGEELDLTVVVSGTTLDAQGVELQPLAAWSAWLTDTDDADNPQYLPFAYYNDGTDDLMAVAHKGKIYVVGGYEDYSLPTYYYSDKIYTATISPTSLISNAITSWVTQAAALPVKLAAGALVISQTGDANRSYLYAIGGYNSLDGVLNTVYSATVNNVTGEVYTWTKVLTLSEDGLQYHSAVLHEGVIYAIGGEDKNGNLSRCVYTAAIQSNGGLALPSGTYWG